MKSGNFSRQVTPKRISITNQNIPVNGIDRKTLRDIIQHSRQIIQEDCMEFGFIDIFLANLNKTLKVAIMDFNPVHILVPNKRQIGENTYESSNRIAVKNLLLNN